MLATSSTVILRACLEDMVSKLVSTCECFVSHFCVFCVSLLFSQLSGTSLIVLLDNFPLKSLRLVYFNGYGKSLNCNKRTFCTFWFLVDSQYIVW